MSESSNSKCGRAVSRERPPAVAARRHRWPFKWVSRGRFWQKASTFFYTEEDGVKRETQTLNEKLQKEQDEAEILRIAHFPK